MSSEKLFVATIGPMIPGRTRKGSKADYRKGAQITARKNMAGIVAEYAALIKAMEGATPDILVDALRPVLVQALEYVPRDTGSLAESALLEVYRTPSGNSGAQITFGDGDTWYAAIVHEFTWLAHRPPSRSKYLQAAMEEGLDQMFDDIVAGYTGVLG